MQGTALAAGRKEPGRRDIVELWLLAADVLSRYQDAPGEELEEDEDEEEGAAAAAADGGAASEAARLARAEVRAVRLCVLGGVSRLLLSGAAGGQSKYLLTQMLAEVRGMHCHTALCSMWCIK